MFGSTDFIDEIDCGSFFDDLFPNVELEASDSTAINAATFPSIWAAHPESLPCSDSVFFRKSASESDLSAELFVPYENIVQLEWMSKFVEDSPCGASLPMKKEESSSINKASHHQFQTCSPVSVLESSSSSSGAKQLPRSPEAAAPGKRGRPRSKRPRPASFNHLPGAQLISPTSSVNENDIPQPLAVPKVPSDSENYAESRLLIKLPKQVDPEHKKKQKKIKLSLSAQAPLADHNSENPTGQAVRKCTHCEITKTPQWRAGPLGPKTLCNACGVRHKSGRLFPEYRPAASPTFIPSLHSNSHKKVVEMRAKSCTAPMAAKNSLPELIPNKSNPALDYI